MWTGLHRSLSRIVLVASIVSSLVPATADGAGAVLPPNERPDPAFVDVRMAVSLARTGTTRWTEVTVPAGTRAIWLVPIRPGAAIDWAPTRWLDALDEATAPRVLPPAAPSSCAFRSTPERPEAWTSPHASQAAPPLTVQTTATGARAYVADRGYRPSPQLSTSIEALFADGWNLVAVEIAASSSATSTSTLRVRDQGGAVLPLALSGQSSTRLTIFAIANGVSALPETRDVDPRALRWGSGGSAYATWRSDIISAGGGAVWLRESSSHAALFEGAPMPGEDSGPHAPRGRGAPSVVAGYFGATACMSEAARGIGSSDDVVGTVCAPGAAGRVRAPEEPECVPKSGGVDPSALTCGADIDLALALATLAPARAVVTRLVGWVPAGTAGTNLGIEVHHAPIREPVFRAERYDACVPSSTEEPSRAAPSSPSRSPSPGGGVVPTNGGCGGGTVSSTTTYEEEASEDESSSEGCSGGGSSSGWNESDSSESCSADGWDTEDDDGSNSDDGWDSEDDDDGWDSEDDDDGWDNEDGMSPKRKRIDPSSMEPHAKTKRKKASPVSRYALLAAALLLPLRRRRRASEAR